MIDAAPDTLASQLDAGELDMAILNPLDGLGDNFRTEPLYVERYVVMLPPAHRLIDKNALTLRDLSKEAYVDRLSCELRETVMGVCGDLGIQLYARFRSTREDWVQAMVMSGIGFAFVPEFAITHPESITRPLVEPAVERTISLITVPGRKHSPAASAFARLARSHRWS